MQKFELKLRRRDIAETELLNDLRLVAAKQKSTTITRVLYDQHGEFGATTVLRKLGTWNKALLAAGLSAPARQDISNEELFENLAVIWTKLGRQPFGSDISKTTGFSAFSLGTYEKRFGSWNKALSAFIDQVNGAAPILNDQQTDHEPSTQTNRGRRTVRAVNWRLRAQMLIRDNCICKMCGASPAKNPLVQLHVDHIFPWSKGGETVPENLQTLCSVCNIGKSDETF